MNKKNLEKFKLTDKQEKVYTQALKEEYDQAYKGAKAEIIKFISMYGTYNKMTNDIFKNKRYDRLVNAIIGNVSNIKKSNPQEVNSYLKDQYMLNYYYTGFNLETTSQTKLGFKPLSRKKLNPLSITGKISLQQNKEIVKSNIRKAITQSIAQGEGIGDTSKRVKIALEKNMNDALRIAQTETTTISNEADLRAMEQASKSIDIKKQWVSTLDGRTRDRHRRLDGEQVGLDEKFSNGLMFPGDQSAGKPEESINCRCRMIEVINGNEPILRRSEDGVIPYQTYDEWEKNRL